MTDALNAKLRFITPDGAIDSAAIEAAVPGRVEYLRRTYSHRAELTDAQWFAWALADQSREAQGERQLYEMRAIARGLALPPGFYADLYDHQPVGAR